jgi:hypothetical protein
MSRSDPFNLKMTYPMKKYILSFVAGLTLLGSSCSESYFDRYSTDSITADLYLTTVGEVNTVLYSAYAGMRGDFGNTRVAIGDLASDNAYDYKINNSGGHIAIHESAVGSQTTLVPNLWETSYRIIFRSNVVIDNMTDKFPSAPQFNQYVGEAKFLRALAYYQLVRVFGDVPLVLHEIVDPMDSFEVGRESVENVYTQIIDDLKDAIAKLPDFYTAQTDMGKASKTAAEAILADVYVTRGQFDLAKPIYETIMGKEDGVKLGLIDGANYRDIFSALNVNNKEIIFAIRYAYGQTPSMSNGLFNQTLLNGPGMYPNIPGYQNSLFMGTNCIMMTMELEKKFEAHDLRRSVIHTGIQSEAFEIGNVEQTFSLPITLKYFEYRNITDRKVGNTPESGAPTIVSRYADVILKYAECLNEEGDPAGAIAQIKRIRDRAGVTTSIAANYDAVFQAIEDERQLELNLEGHRWFDLVRTGRAQEVMNAYYLRGPAQSQTYGDGSLPDMLADYQYGNLAASPKVEDHELIYPIPDAQRVLSPEKLFQNPGY